MFTIARYFVRKKIAAIALVAIGVLVFSSSGDSEAEAPSSPWAKPAGAAAVAESEDDGFFDDMLAEANGLAAESGFDPRKPSEGAIDGFDNAASAFDDANRR